MPLTVFAAYFSNQYGILWRPLAAAGVIISVPVIALAIAIQKYLIRVSRWASLGKPGN
jgi:ABC-type glycerol-3-phosphate transport system permease component